LVLAAADLAFLALPPQLHRRWAELCLHEAVDVVSGRTATSGTLLGWPGGGSRRSSRLPPAALDTASWLRGLVQALALPIYETLARLDGADMLIEPVKHLRSNCKHWKVTELVATAGAEVSLAGSCVGQDRPQQRLVATGGGKGAAVSPLRESATGIESGRAGVSSIATNAVTGSANVSRGGGDDDGACTMPPEAAVDVFGATMPGAGDGDGATLGPAEAQAVLQAAAEAADGGGGGATDSEVKSEGAADLLLGELLPRPSVGSSATRDDGEAMGLRDSVATIALEGVPMSSPGGGVQAPTQNSSPSDAVAEEMATFLKMQGDPEATLREPDLPGMVSHGDGDGAQMDQFGSTMTSEWC